MPAETLAPDTAATVAELDKQYVLQNYGRYPVTLIRGEGCYVYDTDGKEFLDLLSGIGVNALGHAHPRIVKAIAEQASRLIHISNLYYSEYQGPVAKKLAQMSGLNRTFFANSGAETIEGAIKMIRSHGRHSGRTGVLTLQNSFHGRTIGAISITGQAKYRADFEPLLEGPVFIAPNDTDALELTFQTGRIAGVILECIQGEGGVYPLDERFVRRARELCDEHDALLVFDEIQCGLGRTGKYFQYHHYSPAILPDVVCVAKPLGAGLPIGAILANEKAAATIAPGMHGSTFGGGVLACRVALEFLEILEDLIPHIQEVSSYFKQRLQEIAARYSVIKEVRVYGLMIGIELTIPGKQLVLDALDQGLLINCTHETVLRFLPPYILETKDVDRALEKLDSLFAAQAAKKPESGR